MGRIAFEKDIIKWNFCPRSRVLNVHGGQHRRRTGARRRADRVGTCHFGTTRPARRVRNLSLKLLVAHCRYDVQCRDVMSDDCGPYRGRYGVPTSPRTFRVRLVVCGPGGFAVASHRHPVPALRDNFAFGSGARHPAAFGVDVGGRATATSHGCWIGIAARRILCSLAWRRSTPIPNTWRDTRRAAALAGSVPGSAVPTDPGSTGDET